ncbi:MAG: serine/threonine protein kinase [Myxococcales bacterium]|nr:serine/threonine protein kinase [Myxococcales bacterium]
MVETDDARKSALARVGATLRGKWRLEGLLGIGGMAAVYAATHRNGMRGAVKLLHPLLSTDASVRERFLREGYAANSVGHEGAVKVLDDDVTEDGAVFLVMELLEGAAVEALAERHGGRLELPEVVAIGEQFLEVLVAAHAKSIWHRDLKPENLFLTRQGRLKILDFGIAKMKESGGGRATSTGMVMGTPAFMAPEQAMGTWDKVDGRTDLWAVGATLLNLLTGALIHDGETATQVLISAATRAAPRAATFDPRIPPAVAAVIDHALAYHKELRWPDAASMLAALRAAGVRGDLSRLVAELAPGVGARVSVQVVPVGAPVASGPASLARVAADPTHHASGAAGALSAPGWTQPVGAPPAASSPGPVPQPGWAPGAAAPGPAVAPHTPHAVPDARGTAAPIAHTILSSPVVAPKKPPRIALVVGVAVVALGAAAALAIVAASGGSATPAAASDPAATAPAEAPSAAQAATVPASTAPPASASASATASESTASSSASSSGGTATVSATTVRPPPPRSAAPPVTTAPPPPTKTTDPFKKF